MRFTIACVKAEQINNQAISPGSCATPIAAPISTKFSGTLPMLPVNAFAPTLIIPTPKSRQFTLISLCPSATGFLRIIPIPGLLFIDIGVFIVILKFQAYKHPYFNL